MSTHVRSQIRVAVATALAGLPTTDTRVFQSRMRPQGDANLPCLLIQGGNEEIAADVSRNLHREITIVVTGYAKDRAGLDDVLDTMALEVEAAIAAAGTFGGLLPRGLLPAAIAPDFEDVIDKPCGSIVMAFRGLYFTAAGNPAGVL